MPDTTDTIAAPATPPGRSALAIVRISGPEASAISRHVFGIEAQPRAATRADYVDGAGAVLDDVLFTRYVAPSSYTGEDLVEISCHGSPLVVQRVLEDLIARGCRLAGPGEFTQRAFLNGRLDLSQAEGVMDVIHARGERALAAANRLLRGELGGRTREFVDSLLLVLSRIEAHIDFPEEDLPAEDRGDLLSRLETLGQGFSKLLATNRYGDILRQGAKVLIVGPTNAGKSSVLNRLVGMERALVSAEPGTTRDYIEEGIEIGGHEVRLIDTAGLNPAPGEIEKLGIDRTIQLLADSDFFLLVIDRTARVEIDPKVLSLMPESRSVLILNKSDIQGNRPALSPALADLPAIEVSALTGSGCDAIVEFIGGKLAAMSEDIGESGIAINARHAEALGRAESGVSDARQKLIAGEPMELIANCLRDSLAALGEIAGRIDNERMLDRLFSDFCIGK